MSDVRAVGTLSGPLLAYPVYFVIVNAALSGVIVLGRRKRAAAPVRLSVGETGFEPVTSSVQTAEPRYHNAKSSVGDTGFEPVTSSVQTAEPRYHNAKSSVGDTGFEPVTSSV